MNLLKNIQKFKQSNILAIILVSFFFSGSTSTFLCAMMEDNEDTFNTSTQRTSSYSSQTLSQEQEKGKEVSTLTVHDSSKVSLTINNSKEDIIDLPTAHLKGFSPRYNTNVSSEEWRNALSQLEEELDKTQINPILTPSEKEEWKKSFDIFLALYQTLDKNYSKTIKKIKKDINKEFFSPLFDFTAYFEGLYDALRLSYTQQEKSFQHLGSILHPVQKAWNLYLKAYENLTNQELTSFGNLGFSKIHKGHCKHLFYIRNEEGFLLFTIYPHEPLTSDLYLTYAQYGLKEDDDSRNRDFLFSKSSQNNSIRIIEEPGLIIEKKNEALNITPYSGSQAFIPFASASTLVFGIKPIFKTNLNKSLIKAGLPERVQHASITALSFSKKDTTGFHLIGKMEGFLSSLLGGSKARFILYPQTDLDHMEAEYVFLQDLYERYRESPDDQDVLYALEYVKETFQNQNLEEIIADHETTLEHEYFNKEKEILEAQIRAEQAERTKMVANAEHYKIKPKNKKQIKKKEKQSITPEKNDRKFNPEEIEATARANAKRRVELLKNKEIRGHMKYKDYLRLVNAAAQELRRDSIPVSGRLNASSHGSLEMGDKTLPIYRPHGRHKTVHVKSARNMLSNLLDCYFAHLRGSIEYVEK